MKQNDPTKEETFHRYRHLQESSPPYHHPHITAPQWHHMKLFLHFPSHPPSSPNHARAAYRLPLETAHRRSIFQLPLRSANNNGAEAYLPSSTNPKLKALGSIERFLRRLSFASQSCDSPCRRGYWRAWCPGLLFLFSRALLVACLAGSDRI